MLHALGNHPQLGKPAVWLLQEVSPEEEGLHCFREHKWTVLAKKGPDEWRGTGIAYHADSITHVDTPTASEASIGATLYTAAGSKLHFIAAHLPHHATLDQTHHILQAWQEHHPQLQRHPCVIGADWNETFHTANQTATTARGEVILDWLSQQHQHLPHQQDNTPSYHPYNTQMRSRRLDYLSTSRKILQSISPVPGSRDYAQSDHDAVISHLTHNSKQEATANTYAHHPRKLKMIGAVIPRPPTNSHPWDSLVALAAAVTEAYPKCKFQESRQLKQHRHKLTSGQIPADQIRQHWKLIQAAHKRERKKWDHAQAVKAARGDWNAYRQSKQSSDKPQQFQWGHRLITTTTWQQHMTQHFEAIFKQQPPNQVASEFARMRQLLSSRCKASPFTPVQEAELRAIQAKWKRKKATGPGQVSNEALQFFLTHDQATSKLIWVLDDALYKGNSPSSGLSDITVLLPKTAQPTSWKDTRPITLSNTIDRTMAQLLLHRCNHILQQSPPIHQFARAGKQASELLATIRRMTRMSRDWGFNLWILKIDIRKAFDTIKQTSVAAMVAGKLQHTHPWEARAWLSIIHGTELHVIPAPPAIQQPINIGQCNGVRQGSPDSPILFALKAGQILENTLTAHQTPPPIQGNPGPPHEGVQFMDDTYLWATDLTRLQKMANDLQQRLLQHGMSIQPDKTQFTQSHTTEHPSTIKLGKETIRARDPSTPLSVFNQPVSFQANESHLAAHLATKARNAFHKQKHILTSSAPILAKLRLIATTITTAALWGCESWPVHHTLLTAANTTQSRIVARAMGLKKRPGETGAEHYQRQIRQARLAVFKNHQTRWSTHTLQSIWKLHGHIARQKGATPDNVAQATLEWRNLAWWKTEQAKPKGARHTARHNPFLDVERYIVHTAGLNWQQTAQNRQAWTQLQASFVHEHDIPWSTGKQPSVQNLHQTGAATTSHPPSKARTLMIHDMRPPTSNTTNPPTNKHIPLRRRKKERRRRQVQTDRAWQQLLAQLEQDSA